MKKLSSFIFAALLVTGVAISGCSSKSDDVARNDVSVENAPAGAEKVDGATVRTSDYDVYQGDQRQANLGAVSTGEGH